MIIILSVLVATLIVVCVYLYNWSKQLSAKLSEVESIALYVRAATQTNATDIIHTAQRVTNLVTACNEFNGRVSAELETMRKSINILNKSY